jgi:putative colanic acid biosynthesis UDP-glucose lipid carrier transferase
VKPGITGWAQVNGLRGETSDPELMRRRVAHDIWYARNASFMLDVRILLLTAVEVFRQRNAH